MSGASILRRLGVFLGAMVLIDMAIISAHSPLRETLDDCFRLTKGQEAAVLPRYIDHIKNVGARRLDAGRQGDTIVFLGSSPAYGHRIRERHNTYPCVFGRESEKRVFNLAANGYLLSDEYYIMRSLIDSADGFVIQLNYNSFNPRVLAAAKIRNPDMPEIVGTPVPSPEAATLGRRPSPEPNLNLPVQRFLRKHWALYRDRDAVAAQLFGKKPELALFEATRAPGGSDELFGGAGDADTREAVDPAPLLPSFDRLSPVQQTIIAKRFGSRSHFTFGKRNSELYYIGRMVDLLKTKKKKAVFFMTPLNSAAIDRYGLISPREYRANIASLAGLVRESGFLWLDYGGTPWLSEKHFYDISHTVDSGGVIVGRRLAADSRGYLRSAGGPGRSER